jgi:16S rRNA (cytosine967-C5)-methyltransferase
VQDAAAALPVRLFGDVRGKSVAELCAAPGGKTAQLALAGAQVSAVDRSSVRLNRLRENLARLSLSAETIAADALDWQAGAFDGVLLDAPCSATGTIRRHPDIPWLKAKPTSGTHIPAATSIHRATKRRNVRILRLLTGARGGSKSDRSAAHA